MQCRLAPRLELLPSSIVEGTANWMAAAVIADWARAEGPFLGNLPGRLLRSAGSIRPITRQGYDAWGFWFQATQGTAHPSLIRTLFRRSANRTRRTNGDAEVRAVVPALEPTLLQYALALRAARPIGGRALPQAYATTFATRRRCSIWGRAGRRPPPSGSSRSATASPAWPGRTMPGRVTIRVAGCPRLVDRDRGRDRETHPAQRRRPCSRSTRELAGEATVVIVNAGRTARSVTVSASR